MITQMYLLALAGLVLMFGSVWANGRGYLAMVPMMYCVFIGYALAGGGLLGVAILFVASLFS